MIKITKKKKHTQPKLQFSKYKILVKIDKVMLHADCFQLMRLLCIKMSQKAGTIF